jgi:hypothetical protein
VAVLGSSNSGTNGLTSMWPRGARSFWAGCSGDCHHSWTLLRPARQLLVTKPLCLRHIWPVLTATMRRSLNP